MWSVGEPLPAMNIITIGSRDLAGWQVAPGLVWLQTRDARIARKLSQRSDARLVVRGVAGGYLRTYELPRTLSFIRRLIARYLVDCELPTNERFSDSDSSLSSRAAKKGAMHHVRQNL